MIFINYKKEFKALNEQFILLKNEYDKMQKENDDLQYSLINVTNEREKLKTKLSKERGIFKKNNKQLNDQISEQLVLIKELQKEIKKK